MELRLEEEGLAWDEDRTDTLVTEPWYLGLGYASCKGRKIAGQRSEWPGLEDWPRLGFFMPRGAQTW